MVPRKKGIGSGEKTASVSTLEGWCKNRGENTRKNSRKGMDTQVKE